MKKLLAVIYSEDDWSLDQPKFGLAMSVFYSIFNESCEYYDLDLVRTSTQWFNDNSSFDKYWKFEKTGWKKIVEEITPNYIYDYSSTYNKNLDKDTLSISILRKISESYKMLNNPSFTELIGDKVNQSVIFAEFLPKTQVKLRNEVIEKPSYDFVIKNANGSGGISVSFNDEHALKSDGNIIVQEMIDGRDSNGILKDYRFTYVDNIPIYAETRQAPSGSLKTNCSQGAFNKFYLPSEMPVQLLNFANNIALKMKSFRHNVFTIDLLQEKDTNKIYLMETNTKPGLGLLKNKVEIPYDESATISARNFTKAIIRSLVEMDNI